MTPLKLSPLSPTEFPNMPSLAGVELATAATGVKYKDRDDLLLMVFPPKTNLAGVFTKSSTAAVSVHLSKQVVQSNIGRCLLVNAGNANAFTGRNGDQSADSILSYLSKISGISQKSMMMASTGVIGEPLDDSLICLHLNKLWESKGTADWQQAANAIKTTDTFAKASSQTIYFDDQPVHICAIAKGSGMIAPDMATMLGFIVTDAEIKPSLLQKMLTQINAKSFNAITVDSDTSTSDMVILAATATSKVKISSDAGAGELAEKFKTSLRLVMTDLAHQIVKDGEGASKFITVNVKGAISDHSAHIIAKSIANSPLVKTAIAGEDANWGRIVMAVGKAGEPAERDKLSIKIGGILVAENGQKSDGYTEAMISDHMKSNTILIDVDLQLQNGTSTVWTCDLTHDYISINADYRS
ncbi:bifunctional glutamate N-acetyltransferase/amino-acid acetyltransferase ArgJ [Alphaproteobacteria bacterium]|nr:bifunctional glutamate N-acetyltransferase/amino-acid acetyltransferase ArgJ [Alphaproteobacteria bacterium]